MKVEIGPYSNDTDDVDGDRKIEVVIDSYDVWNADHTMALIIHPLLERLLDSSHGSPNVANEDVPEKLRSNKEKFPGVRKKHHKRWKYVLDEMIYSFKTIAEGDDPYGEDERVQNGLNLFAKYYRGLWT